MTISAHRNAGRIVNRSRLASLCRVSLTTVDKWVRDGCPIVKHGSKGIEAQFDFAAVSEWRITRAVEAVTSGLRDQDGRISKDEADRRRAVAQAISAEIEANDALASVVARSDADALMAEFCGVIRSALNRVPGEVAAQAAAISNPSQIRELIEAATNRAFIAAETAFSAQETTP